MKPLIIILALTGLIIAQDSKSLLDYCANPPKTPLKPLEENFVLPESYKISGSITDWMKASTSLLVETSTKDYRVVQRNTRDQLAERWVQNLSGNREIMFVNVTSGECNANSTNVELVNVPRFSSILGAHTPSIYSIIQEILPFVKAHQGFVVENHVDNVGGVNSAKWISCVDGNETKVLLEVRYAGEGSIRPAQSPFSNPLVLSIRLAELPTFNSTVAVNHVSIELDRYELPAGNEAIVEHGIYCDNRNATDLPLKRLDEYAAILNYFDYDSNRSEVVEVLYSKSRGVFIVSGDAFENGVKILKAAPEQYRKGTDYILHDFKYGYEFTMSRDACKSFSTLPNTTADSVTESNSSLVMVPMEMMLVNSEISWFAYDSDSDEFDQKLATFRAFDASDSHNRSVIELHLTKDGEVHSMATYRMGTRQLAQTLTVSRIPIEASRLNLKAARLSDCYDNGTSGNNTWIVQVKDKKLSDLSQVGLNRLNEAVAASISKNVYPIIPYRVVVFWLENKDNGLALILRLAEKTTTIPAQVGYNFTAELPTADVFNLLKDAMILDKMPIMVQKLNGVEEKWTADANTLKTYPKTDTGFVGYTGGAMWVLAIFTLLIGASIGAVGVFVATRRQRISTLAYQVFE